jgi:hypothetical protein
MNAGPQSIDLLYDDSAYQETLQSVGWGTRRSAYRNRTASRRLRRIEEARFYYR